MGCKKHYRLHHWIDEFVHGKNHLNGIESFREFTKIQLEKIYGIPKTKFNLHLTECEYGFNNRNKNIYYLLLKECKKKP